MNSVAGDAGSQHDVIMKFRVAALEEMATAVKGATVKLRQGSRSPRTEFRRS
jgi:hypothetical protein